MAELVTGFSQSTDSGGEFPWSRRTESKPHLALDWGLGCQVWTEEQDPGILPTAVRDQHPGISMVTSRLVHLAQSEIAGAEENRKIMLYCPAIHRVDAGLDHPLGIA